MATYSENRKVWTYADYPLAIYESLIQKIKANSAIRLGSFTDISKDGVNLPNVTCRHDIDTALCVERMSSLLNIDLQHQVSSGTYIRADEEEYALNSVRSQVEHFRGLGLEIGLHTVCYRQDDYFQELKREIGRFEDELGFRPTSFTVHGLGQYRIDIRRDFYQKVIGKMQEIGMVFTDCNAAFRRYHYVIEDCHFDQQLKQRFIYKDFHTLPPFFKPGLDYLVLTHPCYWQ